MFSPVPFWSKIPFFRLLVPLIIGILLQWNCRLALHTIYYTGAIVAFLFILTQFFSLRTLFQFGWVIGLIINGLLILLGMLLVYRQNVHNESNYFGRFYANSSAMAITLLEPLVEKENTFKAMAAVHAVMKKEKLFAASGKIIVYFKKDSSVDQLHFGTTIVFNRAPNEIKNTGNPGAFDYKRYCLFNGITHQVYLTEKDYVVVPGASEETFGMRLDGLLIAAREKTITVLRKFISSKKELGLAEALLIGYKDDLDKGLIQSYTNTGVVHIIAISGQHLALIYWLLLQVLSPLKRTKALRWITTIIIISILWLFSLMTGAQPSIIRAALMCTIMLLAEVFSRRSNTLNSLACSAFILLCFNPFDLWDVGFQLSYAGLLSLVLFTKAIYNVINVENMMLRHVWQLVSATIAAQILTTPISIFHFHQFPFSFLLTNLLAVPLSSLILTTELLLFALSFITPLAMLTGKLLVVFIWLMNTWVERIGGLHGLLWDGLKVSLVQTMLLYVAIIGFAIWLLNEIKQAIWIGIVPLVLLIILRTYSFRQCRQQRQMIVYNVPKHHAIDLVDGRQFYFMGNEELVHDGFLKNFNIKPARTLYRLQSLQSIGDSNENISFTWYGKRIVIAGDANAIKQDATIDVLILSKAIHISFNASSVKKVVLEASIPPWKTKSLKEALHQLHIPFHDVNTDGAFVIHFK